MSMCCPSFLSFPQHQQNKRLAVSKSRFGTKVIIWQWVKKGYQKTLLVKGTKTKPAVPKVFLFDPLRHFFRAADFSGHPVVRLFPPKVRKAGNFATDGNLSFSGHPPPASTDGLTSGFFAGYHSLASGCEPSSQGCLAKGNPRRSPRRDL